MSVVGNGTPSGNRITIGRNPSIDEKRAVMEIDWTTRAELSESIPPAYTEFLGGQLMAHLGGTRVVPRRVELSCGHVRLIYYSKPRRGDDVWCGACPTPGYRILLAFVRRKAA